jgi:hypothetical protein
MNTHVGDPHAQENDKQKPPPGQQECDKQKLPPVQQKNGKRGPGYEEHTVEIMTDLPPVVHPGQDVVGTTSGNYVFGVVIDPAGGQGGDGEYTPLGVSEGPEWALEISGITPGRQGLILRVETLDTPSGSDQRYFDSAAHAGGSVNPPTSGAQLIRIEHPPNGHHHSSGMPLNARVIAHPRLQVYGFIHDPDDTRIPPVVVVARMPVRQGPRRWSLPFLAADLANLAGRQVVLRVRSLHLLRGCRPLEADPVTFQIDP